MLLACNLRSLSGASYHRWFLLTVSPFCLSLVTHVLHLSLLPWGSLTIQSSLFWSTLSSWKNLIDSIFSASSDKRPSHSQSSTQAHLAYSHVFARLLQVDSVEAPPTRIPSETRLLCCLPALFAFPYPCQGLPLPS